MQSQNSLRILALLIVGLGIPKTANSQFSYVTNGNALTIMGYTGLGGSVQIPTNINGLLVTSIAAYAFQNQNSITSITMPNTITNIGEFAFYHCASLTDVTIPDSVTNIGDNAFWDCFSLTNVTIPDSVTSIGGGVFADCSHLSSIIIPNSMTSIGGYGFAYCGQLATVTIPNSATNIGAYAFYDCWGMTNATIGNGVTSIGDSAFNGCNTLESVYFQGNAPSYAGSAIFAGDPVAVYRYQQTTGWGSTFGNAPVIILGPLSTSPTILTQPQDDLVNALASTSLTVTAYGTLPLSYQWSINGTNIAGATLSNLTIPNVRQLDLGAYSVVVTNDFGTVTSSNAVLSMYPYIQTPFSGAITYWGKDATLSVTAWGTLPLSYQWYQNGSPILNATNSTVTLTNIAFSDAGMYLVIVSNQFGTVTNTPAQVLVYPAGVSVGLCPSVTISGVVGYNYIIQRNADLTNTNSWQTMTNLTLTQPIELWVDTSTDATLPENSFKFYRVLPGQ